VILLDWLTVTRAAKLRTKMGEMPIPWELVVAEVTAAWAILVIARRRNPEERAK